MTLSESFLGKEVEAVMDRPMGTLHPEKGFFYPINYGYIPGVISGDGEELDVYVLGVFEPLKKFKGKVIAVIHRLDEDDDKLILTDGRNYSDEQIDALTEFQERFHKHVILRR